MLLLQIICMINMFGLWGAFYLFGKVADVLAIHNEVLFKMEDTTNDK